MDVKQEVGSEKEIQLVSFFLGDEEYGVDIMKVQEIIKMQEITEVPQVPAFVEGVINLRGNVIPVIDLRKRFGLPEVENTKDTRIIVVEIGDTVVGIVVDGVSEVLRIKESLIDPPPKMIAGIGREYLKGIGRLGERLLILLDLDKVLTADEKEVIKQVG